MYLTGISYRMCRLLVTAVMAVGATGVAFAGHADMTGSHAFNSMFPEGCRMASDGDTNSPADKMQAFADELGLTGQQQQDLQILTADYGERLRDLAKLMRESGTTLMSTEPGDPNYWPLTQEFSATVASSSAETVILISELRENVNMLLTFEQRTELKRRIDERKTQCKKPAETEESAE